uniref:Bromo domain-containing protein n=1 Tax=Phaeomonas parva TaxID=124430 RepID=A0A7S1XIG0_9STRA|mmetsp:Transcript_11115/g.33809  ORF Transcript_11115/g.33809 Transcript_11115/m.33809 type:complete len:1401 (+) Transcript_11115:116-4318(+)
MAQKSLHILRPPPPRRRERPRFSEIFGPYVAGGATAPDLSKRHDELLRALSNSERYPAPADEALAFETSGIAAPASLPVRGVDEAAAEGIVGGVAFERAFETPGAADAKDLPVAMHAVQYLDWDDDVKWEEDAGDADDEREDKAVVATLPNRDIERVLGSDPHREDIWVNGLSRASNGAATLPPGFSLEDPSVFLGVPRHSYVDADAELQKLQLSSAMPRAKGGSASSEQRRKQRTQEELQQVTRSVYHSLGMSGWSGLHSGWSAAASNPRLRQAQQRLVHQARIQHPEPALQHMGVTAKLTTNQKKFFHRPRTTLPRKPAKLKRGEDPTDKDRQEKQWRLLATKKLVNRSLNANIFRRNRSGETANVQKVTDLILPVADQAGQFVLLEHMAERPLYVSNLGMSSRLVLYSRSAEEANAQKKRGWRQFVRTVVPVSDDAKSPFLGNISEQAAIRNALYRAPIFPHEPRRGGLHGVSDLDALAGPPKGGEWFLLVFISDRYLSPHEMKRQTIMAQQQRLLSTIFAVREIPRGGVFVVGQEEPIHPIQPPGSDATSQFERAFYAYHLAKLMQVKKRDGEEVISIHQATLNYPDASKANLKLALSDLAAESAATPGLFRLRPDAPTADTLASALTPEAVCAYQSMLVAWIELRKLGVTPGTVDAERLAWALHVYDNILSNIDGRRNILKAKLKALKASANRSKDRSMEMAAIGKLCDQLRSADQRMRRVLAIARFVNEQLQLAPWTQYEVFNRAQNAQGNALHQMEILGIGDPSGCNQGFSYTREYLAQLFHGDQVKTTGSSNSSSETSKDLRKLTTKELNRFLKGLGVTDAKMATMERWDKTNLLADWATNHSHKPQYANLRPFVRERKRSTKDLFREYQDKLQATWDRQVAALRADATEAPRGPSPTPGMAVPGGPGGPGGAGKAPQAKPKSATVAPRSATNLGNLLSDEESSDDEKADDGGKAGSDDEDGAAPTGFLLPNWQGQVYFRVTRRIYQKGKEEIVVRFDRRPQIIEAFKAKSTAIKKRADKVFRREKDPAMLFETKPREPGAGKGASGAKGARAGGAVKVGSGGLSLKITKSVQPKSKTTLKLSTMQRKAAEGAKSKQRKRKRQEDKEANAYAKPKATTSRSTRVKRPTVRLNEKFSDVLYGLFGLKNANEFKRRVKWQDYLDKIPQPICIADMLERTKNPNKMYTNRRQLLADVDLMAMNAENYNGATHPIAVSGRELEKTVQAALRAKDQFYTNLEREVEEEEEAREKDRERYSKGGKGKGGKGKKGKSRSPTSSPAPAPVAAAPPSPLVVSTTSPQPSPTRPPTGASPRPPSGTSPSSPMPTVMDMRRRSPSPAVPAGTSPGSGIKSSPAYSASPGPRPKGTSAAALGSLLASSDDDSSSGEEEVLEAGT